MNLQELNVFLIFEEKKKESNQIAYSFNSSIIRASEHDHVNQWIEYQGLRGRFTDRE